MSLQPLWGLIANRELVREMAIRDAKEINKGSILGNAWLVLRPLIQTAAYVVIVSFVFQARLGPDSGPLDYALYVLCGMVPWQLIVQSLVAAPSLVRIHAQLVKQTVYPVETLPMRTLVASSFSSLVSLCVFLVLAAATGELRWTVILAPIPLTLLVLFLVGSSWALMVAGVYLQDFREVIGATMNLLILLSPVVVSPQMVSPQVWTCILSNPLSHIIICFRDVCSAEFHLMSWSINLAMTSAALLLGAAVLSRARVRMNDYL
jgi:lipopolysaccharide transport system permease protein